MPVKSVHSMRATIARRKHGSVWGQLRKAPNFDKVEHAWITRASRPGEIINVTRKSDILGISDVAPRIRARSDIHTHILNRNIFDARHSVVDLSIALDDVLTTKIRTWHVISIRKGVPAGVVVLHADNRFVKWAKRNRKQVSKMSWDIYFHQKRIEQFETPNDGNRLLDNTMRFLQEKGMKVRVRARPGFVFDGVSFVPIPRSRKKQLTQ